MALKCLVSLSAPGGRFSLSISTSGGERSNVATVKENTEEEELESTARKRRTREHRPEEEELESTARRRGT